MPLSTRLLGVYHEFLLTKDSDPQLTIAMEGLQSTYQTVKVDKNRLTAGTSDHRPWSRPISRSRITRILS